MREIVKKRQVRRLVFSYMTAGVSAILLVLGVSATWGVYGKYRETERVRQSVEAHVAALDARKDQLTSSIDRLTTERGVEKEIRERFGFVREGEEVIMIVDEASGTPQREMVRRGWFGVMMAHIALWFSK